MPCPFTGPQMFCDVPNFLSQPKNLTAFMPCPFTGRKMFCAGPNFLCRTKNLFTYCASYKHFVPDRKIICIQYTQYPFIRNALIRNNAEISGNFKKPAFKGSNLRNALK